MNILDYLTEKIADDQLIKAVSEYLDEPIPANEIQALRADTRLLQAIFIIPILVDCYASSGTHTKHHKDCVINLVYSSLNRHTEPYRSI